MSNKYSEILSLIQAGQLEQAEAICRKELAKGALKGKKGSWQKVMLDLLALNRKGKSFSGKYSFVPDGFHYLLSTRYGKVVARPDIILVAGNDCKLNADAFAPYLADKYDADRVEGAAKSVEKVVDRCKSNDAVTLRVDVLNYIFKKVRPRKDAHHYDILHIPDTGYVDMMNLKQAVKFIGDSKEIMVYMDTFHCGERKQIRICGNSDREVITCPMRDSEDYEKDREQFTLAYYDDERREFDSL